MKEFLKKVGSCVPFVRKYLKLDAEEKRLLPLVKEKIERVMREGTEEEKKYITDKIRSEMKKNKMEIPA